MGTSLRWMENGVASGWKRCRGNRGSSSSNPVDTPAVTEERNNRPVRTSLEVHLGCLPEKPATMPVYLITRNIVKSGSDTSWRVSKSWASRGPVSQLRRSTPPTPQRETPTYLPVRREDVPTRVQCITGAKPLKEPSNPNVRIYWNAHYSRPLDWGSTMLSVGCLNHLQ